jgi:hypothetical protein
MYASQGTASGRTTHVQLLWNHRIRKNKLLYFMSQKKLGYRSRKEKTDEEDVKTETFDARLYSSRN